MRRSTRGWSACGSRTARVGAVVGEVDEAKNVEGGTSGTGRLALNHALWTMPDRGRGGLDGDIRLSNHGPS